MNYDIVSPEQVNQILIELTNKTKNIFATKEEVSNETSDLQTRIAELETIVARDEERIAQLEQEVTELKNILNTDIGGE